MAGFNIQDKKTQGPARTLEFLGIVINTIDQTLQISEDRLEEIRLLISSWLSGSSAPEREVLSLLGKLNFCAQVVHDGTKFTRRLVQAAKVVKKLHYQVVIGTECQKDLVWWHRSISTHNGICMFPREWDTASAQVIFTDASNMALGAVYGFSWSILEFVGPYEYMLEKSIAWQEMAPIILCLAVFGTQLANQQVFMKVDNEAIRLSINKGYSKDPEVMCLIRSLYYYTIVW